jgi:hypothetical protein
LTAAAASALPIPMEPGDPAMARAKRTLDRKALREQSDAAERRKRDEEIDETEDEEEDEDDEDEDEEGDESEASAEDEDEDADEEDEDEPRPKKKKVAKAKAPAKPRATKSRARSQKTVRMRQVWAVYSNSHQVIEEFDYPQKKAAEELVAKLTNDKKPGHPFFLQPLKKPMEKEKEKEKEK